MRVAVVVNPVVAEEAASRFETVLRTESLEARWFQTTEKVPGRGQTMDALEWGADVVFVCGGDGTVRECAEALVGTRVPLGLVPAGTGNLLALNLGLPNDPTLGLTAALNGSSRSLDTGHAAGEVFVVMAGAGLDAEIMANTQRASKERLGSFAYVVEGAQSMFDEPVTARIYADRGELAEGSFVSVLVGNMSKLQGGVDLFPDSEPDDGLLDLLAIRSESKSQTLQAAAQAALGTTGDSLVRAQASRIHFDFESPTRYELDGEPRWPVTALDIEVKHRSLVVCVPEKDPI